MAVESDNINTYERILIGGFRTAILTSSELAQLMVQDCIASRDKNQLPKLVFSSNGYSISLAGRKPQFADVMQKADIIHADGMSVVFASWLMSGKRLPERVATTDFFHVAASKAEAYRLRFYFLGGSEEVNEEAYTRMQNLYPGVQWVGRHHGYFQEHEEDTLCNKIRAAGPDVLWIGLGRPRQEFFSVRNREKLSGIGWIKTCGGLFDYLSGNKQRAPVWIQRTGFEWFWRVIQEPKRLFWRYLVTNVHALWRIAVYSRAEK